MKNKLSINLEVTLIEIIFSILIFSIAGIIMLYCFGAARFTQIKANDMVKAGSIVQSNVEIIRAFDNDNSLKDYMSKNFQFNTIANNENIYTSCYDKNWNLCDANSNNIEYLIKIKISDIAYPYGKIINICVKAEKSKSYPFITNNKNSTPVIYEINTKRFFPSYEGRW